MAEIETASLPYSELLTWGGPLACEPACSRLSGLREGKPARKPACKQDCLPHARHARAYLLFFPPEHTMSIASRRRPTMRTWLGVVLLGATLVPCAIAQD